MPTRKTVKDDEGHEYEIEIEDEDEGEEDGEDEDDENIYLTEADLRWLKQARKAAASNSQTRNGKESKPKPSGIAVKKRSQNNQTVSTSKKSRAKRLTLST